MSTMMMSFTVVLTPVVSVTSSPSAPLLLTVNDSATLTCMGMSGPRLVLIWDRDGATVIDGDLGNDTLEYSFTADNETFGNYTCTATIDDMNATESVEVIGMCYIPCVSVCLSVCLSVYCIGGKF